MLRCIITLCIVSVSWFASADTEAKKNVSPTAQSFYEEMLNRAPNAMYEGIFIHQAGNQTQSVEIVHGTNDGVIWERLLHLDGLTREVIRRGEALYCIHPDQSVEQVQQQGSSPFANTELGSIRQLTKAYEFRNLGKQRIAGRMVEGIQLAPKDASRHFYQLWLDIETMVPLRTELVSRKGQVLERYQFSYFAPKTEFIEERFEPRTKGAILTDAQMAKVLKTTQQDVLEWRLNWIPVGFENEASTGYAPKLSARRIYSDGIVMFSVYVEQVEKTLDEGTAQSGPTVLAVQHKQWHGQTHRITVVGEIPAATAQRIAQSVELL